MIGYLAATLFFAIVLGFILRKARRRDLIVLGASVVFFVAIFALGELSEAELRGPVSGEAETIVPP